MARDLKLQRNKGLKETKLICGAVYKRPTFFGAEEELLCVSVVTDDNGKVFGRFYPVYNATEIIQEGQTEMDKLSLVRDPTEDPILKSAARKRG